MCLSFTHSSFLLLKMTSPLTDPTDNLALILAEPSSSSSESEEFSSGASEDILSSTYESENGDDGMKDTQKELTHRHISPLSHLG